MKKRKKKRTSGVKLLAAFLLTAALFAAGDQKPRQSPYALLVGTVFREPGFALPGAEIVLVPDPAKSATLKLKTQHASSDSRGEFAVRVPPASGEWKISVKAAGFGSQEKSVTVVGEERLDVYFELKATK